MINIVITKNTNVPVDTYPTEIKKTDVRSKHMVSVLIFNKSQQRL